MTEPKYPRDVIWQLVDEDARKHLNLCDAGYVDAVENGQIFILCCGCGDCVQVIQPPIKMTINRPDDKSFTAVFPTIKDIKNFQHMLETIVANVKKETKQET
jgi:hypothetical protein